MWECSKCHEQVEDNFEVCWNCGTAVDGTEDPEFTRSDVYPAKPEAEDVVMAEPTEPPVVAPRTCARCGSRDVIPNVRIIDRSGRSGGLRRDLQVEVYEDPNALIFWGTHAGTLSAWICGRCGFADLYVDNPGELLAAYRESKVNEAG